MKKVIFSILLLLLFQFSYSQDVKATTEKGVKVILKKDMTWEVDKSIDTCQLGKDFKEPLGEKDNQSFLKTVDATVKDMKKHVSIDMGVPEKNIILIELSEQKGNAIYVLCINGMKFKYRRSGSVFFKDGSEPKTF